MMPIGRRIPSRDTVEWDFLVVLVAWRAVFRRLWARRFELLLWAALIVLVGLVLTVYDAVPTWRL